MAPNGYSQTSPNQTSLNRVKLQASVDEAEADSLKLMKAAASLASAASQLQTIAIDVGWTGLSAESSAETFNSLGGKLHEHSANISTLQRVAEDAETLVAVGRKDADDVATLHKPLELMPFNLDAPVQQARDIEAQKALQSLNGVAVALQARAALVTSTAQGIKVDPDDLVPEPAPDLDDASGDGGGGYGDGGYGGGGRGVLGGPSVSGPYGSTGSATGAWSGSGVGGGGADATGGSGGAGTAGGGSGSGYGGGAQGGSSGGGFTSVDGSTGGYVTGGSAYGALDRGGASALGASAGAGGTLGGGSGGGALGTPGLGAGAMGAGAAGIMGGTRSGAFGGGAGGLGRSGGAGSGAVGGGVSGTTAGGRAGAPGSASGTSGAAGTRAGTTGAMMGGGGAGGAGGSSKKGRRTSSTYLAPRLDDELSAPGRVSAMRAGSRAELAATPPPPDRPERADDEW